MTALVLTLLACTAHGACRDYPAPLPPESGPMACIIGGQQLAAVFQAEHPALVVRGWRCGPERVRT